MPKSFSASLDSISKSKKSNLILALDLRHRKDTTFLLHDAKEIVEATSDYLCAVKINYHLMLPLSILEISSLNNLISQKGLVSIAES